MKNKKYSVRIDFGPRQPSSASGIVELRAEAKREDREPLIEHGAMLAGDYGDNRQDAIARIAMAALESTLHEDASFKRWRRCKWSDQRMTTTDSDPPRVASATNGAISVLNPALAVMRDARRKCAVS